MIKRIVLIGLVCLLAVLISSCGDNRTTTGYSRGDSAGDGEPESSTSSDQSDSSTSVASSSSNEDYVDKYADLLAAYNANSGGLSKSDWGKNHYCVFGQIEGRTSSGLSSASCSTTSASSVSSNGTDTKSTSQTKENVNTSTVSADLPHLCYGDYTRKYPDLLDGYNRLTQPENKPSEEGNGGEECKFASDDLGSQRRVNISCSVGEFRSRAKADQTIEEWGFYHYRRFGKAEGRRLPSSCPWVRQPTRQKCLVKGTPVGDPVGPNLNGRWNSLFTRYTGTTSVGIASVSHTGTRIVIQTNLGLTWSGSIDYAGNMFLCDSKGEDWTTTLGPATRTSVRLADFVIKNALNLGTQFLYLSR